MRFIGTALLVVFIIGAVITLGVTGIIDMIVTGWTTITAPGGAQ